MASEPKEVQNIQLSILQKIGDKTLAEHLEDLEAMDALNPLYAFHYSPDNTAQFCKTLAGQPAYILNILYKNKAFQEWLQKALFFLSPFFNKSTIFNPRLQQKLQPLLDLLYYFNQADSTIRDILCRFEVIKLLTEKSGVCSEDYIKIYNAYFEERINTAVFLASDECISDVIGIAFVNCCADPRPSFRLESQLEQACFVAWLIPHIKNQPNFKLLDESQYEKLNIYLNALHKKYFSVRAAVQTYSFNNKANSSLAALFATAKKRVENILENIPPHDYAAFQQEIDLKHFFLQLFDAERILSFFPYPKYQFNIVNTIRETDEAYIDWHYVLERLLAEIDKSSLDISEITVLSQHINSFIEKQEQVLRLKIPALSDPNMAIKSMEYTSSLSPKQSGW